MTQQDPCLCGHHERRLLAELPVGAYCLNARGEIALWNAKAEEITGFAADSVLGRSCADGILRHTTELGQCLCEDGCPMACTMGDGQVRQARVFLHHAEGHRLPVDVKIVPSQPDRPEEGAIHLFRDTNEMIAARQEIRRLEDLARTDPMTGLANRRHTEETVAAAMSEFWREGRPFGLIMLDIDHFKRVNDTYGHDMGDRVIRMVGRTCASVCRPHDTFGRWGGEEFLAVAKVSGPASLYAIAERMRSMVSQAFLAWQGQTVLVTVSLGVAMADGTEGVDALLRRADQAMYASKATGRNRVTFAKAVRAAS